MQINEPQIVEEGIFVWGSNEVGRSFSGAAKTAVESYGAQLGVSFGFTGQSFAIPTKDAILKPLYINYIKNYVNQFLKIASTTHDGYYVENFMVTRVGCGLAGFTDAQIAPMFENATSNCYFDEAWRPFLGGVASDLKPRKYWGTFSDK